MIKSELGSAVLWEMYINFIIMYEEGDLGVIATNNSLLFQTDLSCIFSEVIKLVNLKYDLCSYESN